MEYLKYEIPELDEFSDNVDVVLTVYWKVWALCMFVDAGATNDISHSYGVISDFA